MAERPATELPMPVPVTLHPKMYAPANHPVSLCCPFEFCLFCLEVGAAPRAALAVVFIIRWQEIAPGGARR